MWTAIIAGSGTVLYGMTLLILRAEIVITAIRKIGLVNK
jgi:hypothetical protein